MLNKTVEVECNILISNNSFVNSIADGWEGIPFNIVINTLISITLLIIFAIIRWRVNQTKDNQLKNSNWLHFIFGDRITNDIIAAKFRLIDRRHRLAYLPPILHEYEDLITDKILEKESENRTEISFYKHKSKEKSKFNEQEIENKSSFKELPTVRSDIQINPNLYTESKISELYSGFDIKLSSQEEDNEANRLKDILLKNKFTKETSNIQKLKKAIKTKFSFDWIYDYIIRDKEISENKGNDALQYLLFQRYLIYFLIFLTFICLAIILPINLQGKSELKNKKLSKTTITNLGKGSNLIWIHSIMTSMIIAIGVYMTNHFSNLIGIDKQKVDKKILLIKNIPKSGRKTALLVKYFNKHFPKVVVKRITFVYNIRELEKLKNNLLNAISSKAYCVEYAVRYNQRCEVRPYCLGNFGGVLGCCSCCPKLDGIFYYAAEKAELKEEIENEVKILLSDPKGIAFIEFEKKSMADEVITYFKSKRFVCMLWFYKIKRLFVTRKDRFETFRWKVFKAPYPEDIEWSDIALDQNNNLFWNIGMHAILLFIFLFLTTPTIVVDTVLRPLANERSPHLEVWAQYFRPYLLMLMTIILPALITLVQNYIPNVTRSALELALMTKIYIFLILMVLILPSLKIVTAAILLDKALDKKSGISFHCLFPSQSSGFFINYVLSSAFVANVLDVMRFSQIVYLVYLIFVSRSIAEYESARQKISFRFSFGIRYPYILLIFTMVVTYSISSPLMAPAGLFYMVVKHLVDRYNLYYAYTPTSINHKMHLTAVLYIYIAFLFLLIQVSTTLGEYEVSTSVIKPSLLVYLTLILFIAMFLFRLFRLIYDLD